MGRNKKSKGGGDGPGCSKKLSEGSRGERLRKREAERAAKASNKRRKLGKKPLNRDKSGGHEGWEKKNANKRRLELARLERLVLKQEDLLRDYRPPVQVVPLDPELKRKRRRRDFYDLDTSHWKLTGAARPADSLPGAGGTELVNERDDWEEGEDLFEKLGGGGRGGGSSDEGGEKGDGEGGFYEGPEACREYLDLNHQLARALHHDNNEAKAQKACSRYERCLELDPADHVMARRGLVRLLLDAGDADKARALIDRFPDDRGCEMAWSLAAIELVAWSVLEEEGAGEDVATAALEVACRANPFVAWNIAHREIFEEVVEHADEIDDPRAGSVEEAFWYMVREGGLWASLEGSSDWVAGFLLENESLPPDPHSVATVDGPQASGNDVDNSSNNNNGNSKGTKRGREDTDRDPKAVASTESSLINGSSSNSSDMFANMFETAVGMAAEAAAEQLGVGVDGEEDDEEGGGGSNDGGLEDGDDE